MSGHKCPCGPTTTATNTGGASGPPYARRRTVASLVAFGDDDAFVVLPARSSPIARGVVGAAGAGEGGSDGGGGGGITITLNTTSFGAVRFLASASFVFACSA